MYHVKSQYQQSWGSIVDDDTVISKKDIKELAKIWNVSISELMEQVEKI
jgi:hypothetical protein